jgi:formamidopyrimidine-DNA glycosylase
MFELPELLILANQMNATLPGKGVSQGSLGNSPHKFVWYNRSHEEFSALTRGKTVGAARAKGRWLFLPLEPGYILTLGECGGKVLYHPAGEGLPKKYHLSLTFADGSALSAATQMWGAMELYERGKECERQYIQGMRPTPTDPEFTIGYFSALIDELLAGEKRSVKSLLTQDQLIPGLGNSSAQDILFRARLHPKHPISALTPEDRKGLYGAILKTVEGILAGGGRYDEVDLFNEPGKYIRLMDKNALERPCPVCGGRIEKMAYLGGSCYFCPICQG